MKPDVVFGAGGYVSGPMLAVAAGRRIPAALLEVDAHMGVANRMASPLVRRVFLSFPIEGLRPPHHVVTGRPVPRAVLDATREQGRMELGLVGDRQVVLVIGGSLGARTLNTAAADAWAEADPGFTVVNVPAARDFALIARRATPHYRVIESRSRSPRCWRRPIWSCPAPAVRCSRSPPPAGRRCSCRRPT